MSLAVVFCVSFAAYFFGSSARMIEKTHLVDRISDDVFFPKVNRMAVTHDILEYPEKAQLRSNHYVGIHEYPDVSRRRMSPSSAYASEAHQLGVQGFEWPPQPDSRNEDDAFYRQRRSPKMSSILYSQELQNTETTPRTTTPKEKEDPVNEEEYIDAYIPEIQNGDSKSLSGIVGMYKMNRQNADKELEKVKKIYRRFQKRSSTTTTAAPASYANEPKDLYSDALTPGVVFRVILAEAILKMQYRNYQLDADASVVEADAEFLRLARKVLADELDNFAQLRRLVEGFARLPELVSPHSCNAQYVVHGVPWTNFTTPEEHMKRWCLFDAVFVDRVSYVVGADKSLVAAVAPPILQCDAATCNALPFVDAIMLEQKLPATHVRRITRCQAECRARCTNRPGCLDKCSADCDEQAASF